MSLTTEQLSTHTPWPTVTRTCTFSSSSSMWKWAKACGLIKQEANGRYSISPDYDHMGLTENLLWWLRDARDFAGDDDDDATSITNCIVPFFDDKVSFSECEKLYHNLSVATRWTDSDDRESNVLNMEAVVNLSSSVVEFEGGQGLQFSQHFKPKLCDVMRVAQTLHAENSALKKQVAKLIAAQSKHKNNKRGKKRRY